MNMLVPSNEVRSHVYGRLSNDPKILERLMETGLTSDYKQMLMDPRKYYVTNGISQNRIDLSQ